MNPIEFLQPSISMMVTEKVRVPELDKIFELASILNPETPGDTTLSVVDINEEINNNNDIGNIIIRRGAKNNDGKTIETGKLFIIEGAEELIAFTNCNFANQVFTKLNFKKSLTGTQFVNSKILSTVMELIATDTGIVFSGCVINLSELKSTELMPISFTSIFLQDTKLKYLEITLEGYQFKGSEIKNSILKNTVSAYGNNLISECYLKNSQIIITGTSGNLTLHNNDSISDCVISSQLPIICTGDNKFYNVILDSDMLNCDFSNILGAIDFTELDLTGTKFNNANLAGSTFLNTLLRDCDFTGATGITNDILEAGAKKLPESGYDFIGVDGSTITIGSLSSVTITITDEDTNPVAGAAISVNGVAKGTTNESGVLVVENVEAGANTVLVTHANFVNKTQVIDVDENTESVEIENLTYKLSGVTFTVKDELNVPVDASEISYYDESEESWKSLGSTDENGELIVEDMRYGTYDYKAVKDHYTTQTKENVVISHESEDIAFSNFYYEICTVTFTVLDLSIEAPIESATVKVDGDTVGQTNDFGKLEVGVARNANLRVITAEKSGYTQENPVSGTFTGLTGDCDIYLAPEEQG